MKTLRRELLVIIWLPLAAFAPLQYFPYTIGLGIFLAMMGAWLTIRRQPTQGNPRQLAFLRDAKGRVIFLRYAVFFGLFSMTVSILLRWLAK